MLEKECRKAYEIRGPVVAGAQREEHGADGEEERGDGAGARGHCAEMPRPRCDDQCLVQVCMVQKILVLLVHDSMSGLPGSRDVARFSADFRHGAGSVCLLRPRDCLFAVASR